MVAPLGAHTRRGTLRCTGVAMLPRSLAAPLDRVGMIRVLVPRVLVPRVMVTGVAAMVVTTIVSAQMQVRTP